MGPNLPKWPSGLKAKTTGHTQLHRICGRPGSFHSSPGSEASRHNWQTCGGASACCNASQVQTKNHSQHGCGVHSLCEPRIRCLKENPTPKAILRTLKTATKARWKNHSPWAPCRFRFVHSMLRCVYDLCSCKANCRLPVWSQLAYWTFWPGGPLKWRMTMAND